MQPTAPHRLRFEVERRGFATLIAMSMTPPARAAPGHIV
jgi:hypothetical protein